ncbi:CCA tRNA nucleotidyltransferase [Pseudalkalibacillus caeni]|uniref:CCA-adding enzyme n=1 Tax=Exobacillus caeni TaxID=2574798 RepID=A0A5R9F0F4_9BACL|nr:CCA tRNA nucleotidyltransferase [Pseudalkalibacillus caeni]TLS35890.1 CCA tRNA nucleotidyltransferase [Pseudalkalibacillus caeni]
MDKIFLEAAELLECLNQNGFEAYFVGGSVRDNLLQKPIHDVDIATSALPDETMELFEHTIPVGIEHGTVIVRHKGKSYEVTTFRKEEDYQDFRRPSAVSFISSIEEDLARRDFTINAIAMDKTGTLVDPFNGREDLKKGIIRTVRKPQDRFKEDPLRIMRAIRFVSQLSFELESSTRKAFEDYAPFLKEIAVERISVEFQKMMTGPSVKNAIRLLLESELHQYLPGLKTKKAGLEKLLKLDMDYLVEDKEHWGILTYVTAENPLEFLKRWKQPSKLIKEVDSILSGVKVVLEDGWSAAELYNYSASYRSIERIAAVITGRKPIHATLEQRIELLPILKRNEIAVNGNDILKWSRKKPGPWVGEFFEQLEKEILNGTIKNEKNDIKRWLEWWQLQ